MISILKILTTWIRQTVNFTVLAKGGTGTKVHV